MEITLIRNVFFTLIFISLNCLALETGNVSGKLYLESPGIDVSFVQFILLELQADDISTIIEKQPFIKIQQPYTSFFVSYKIQQINPQKHYKLGVILSLDSKGFAIFEKHEFPVVLNNKHSNLIIKIVDPPEPID